MKYIYIISLLSIFLATTTVNANYYINVDVAKKNGKSPFVIESPYDIFGFDENGIHRSGEVVDPEGFNAEGLKPDSNSVINSSLNQTLDNAYNTNITQDVVEGNFGYVSGTIIFNSTPVTVSTVENNSVILDNGLTQNPFPSGIELIKNGNIETNSTSANPWQNTVDVYETVSEYYWTPYEFIHTRDKMGLPNCNTSHGTLISSSNHTSTRWRHYANTNYPVEPHPTLDGYCIYMTDSWASSRRTRNVEKLVSSTTTDYFIINANNGDIIDVYMPLRLQVSIDGGLYQDITLNRGSVSSNQLTFEIPNLNARSLDFRITDLRHSTNLTDLTGVIIQPQMSRSN